MGNPLVSVIIPTYNRAEFLGFTIGSVFEQTYKNLQVIVVDDGSMDDTGNIVNSFNNKRITYIKQKHNGASSARNRGIAHSREEYVAFLGSDDIWLSTKIEKQLNAFK